MRTLIKVLVIGVFLLPVLSVGSRAETQQEQIDELKQMIEQNQKQNQELQKKVEQLESEREADKKKLEEQKAEELKKEAEQLKVKEEEKGAVSDLTNFLKSIKPGLFIDFAYVENFNNPQSQNNQMQVFNTRANSFWFDLAQLYLERTPTTEGSWANLVGFRIKLDFGEDPNVFQEGLGANGFDLQEAYLHVLAPVGKGLDIYIGKFVTLAGAEVIESKDDFNYSRSILFGYAIPFTHTGLRFHYATDPFDFTVGVNNGWDDASDNNNGKTFETRLGIAHGIFSLGVVGIFGPEQPNESGNWRELIDVVASITPIKNLILETNLDFGWEQGVTNSDINLQDRNVSWQGVAGYIVYDLCDMVRFALRGEYFNDPEGARTTPGTSVPTGTAVAIPGGKQFWEITPTLQIKPLYKYKPFDNFIVRLEYRHDQSNTAVFQESNGDLRKGQDTAAAEFMYYWGY